MNQENIGNDEECFLAFIDTVSKSNETESESKKVSGSFKGNISKLDLNSLSYGVTKKDKKRKNIKRERLKKKTTKLNNCKNNSNKSSHDFRHAYIQKIFEAFHSSYLEQDLYYLKKFFAEDFSISWKCIGEVPLWLPPKYAEITTTGLDTISKMLEKLVEYVPDIVFDYDDTNITKTDDGHHLECNCVFSGTKISLSPHSPRDHIEFINGENLMNFEACNVSLQKFNCKGTMSLSLNKFDRIQAIHLRHEFTSE